MHRPYRGTQFAAAFEEWKQRYDADPEGFQTHDEFDADPPATYGEGAARYFIKVIDELRRGNDT